MKKSKKYDREFKLNAVKIYHESGKSLNAIGMDLGIPMTTLATWAQQYEANGDDSFRGSGNPMACNEELFRLRKELANVQQERDILKKAVAIFSKAKK